MDNEIELECVNENSIDILQSSSKFELETRREKNTQIESSSPPSIQE
jgi:hypothetical protein